MSSGAITSKLNFIVIKESFGTGNSQEHNELLNKKLLILDDFDFGHVGKTSTNLTMLVPDNFKLESTEVQFPSSSSSSSL